MGAGRSQHTRARLVAPGKQPSVLCPLCHFQAGLRPAVAQKQGMESTGYRERWLCLWGALTRSQDGVHLGKVVPSGPRAPTRCSHSFPASLAGRRGRGGEGRLRNSAACHPAGARLAGPRRPAPRTSLALGACCPSSVSPLTLMLPTLGCPGRMFATCLDS